MRKSSIAFAVVTDSDGFRALEDDWNKLSDSLRPAHFFQIFNWCWLAWQHVSSRRGRRLRLLVGRVDGRVVLIWPLMVVGPFLRFLGSDLFEYHDVLVLPGPQRSAWLKAALRAAKKLGGAALLLRHVRQDADLATFLLPQKIGGRSNTAERSWLIRLDEFSGWQGYLAALPQHLRSDQRRQWRRLAALSSPARFEVVENCDDQLALVQWMLAEKIKWLEARGGAAGELFTSTEYRDFLHGVVPALARENSVMTCRLAAGEENIAASLGFIHRNHFFFFIFTYDPKWASFSPGRLLMSKVIEWCFEHRMETFDMAWSGDDYKSVWSNGQLSVGDHLIPLTVEGRIIETWHGTGCSRFFARPWFKTVARCAPASVRRAIGGRLGSNAKLIADMRPR